MAKNKHVTFGSLGQHEFYMPTTGEGNENRRDRKKCEFYFESTGYCTKIRNQCVGPTVCMKYRVKKPLNTGASKKKNGVGTVVYSRSLGKGKIVTITKDTCTVEFSAGKKVPYKYPDAIKSGLLTTQPPKE